MKQNNFIKLISVLLSLSFVLTATITVFGDDTTTQVTSQGTTLVETTTEAVDQKTAEKTLEEQKKELEKSISDSEKKLKELEKTSKGTQDYIDALDTKIGAMNDQLTVLENEVVELQQDIDKLKPDIEKNKKELESIEKEVATAQKELNGLNTKFQATYNAYCYRLRVMYISGDYSIITALLSCRDVSSFLTRYEMIKSVSKSDTELLQEVNGKMQEICTKQNGLDEKKQKAKIVEAELNEKSEALNTKQDSIESNQEAMAKKKITLAQDRAESDKLLAELTAKNQMYTEYRNEDQALADAVENEIGNLINGLKSPDEVTTAVQGDKSSTVAVNSSSSGGLFSKSDAVLNMKYPATGHYSVSASFPNYSSGKYHGGIDFPCATGSKIVAAQSGIVIKVKRLDYSYGYYIMIYHGTDSQGRTVVTLYAHNSSILVSSGQTVKKGQQIAKSGSTGNSTGPHCHFEVRLDSTRVNPKYYLSK